MYLKFVNQLEFKSASDVFTVQCDAFNVEKYTVLEGSTPGEHQPNPVFWPFYPPSPVKKRTAFLAVHVYGVPEFERIAVINTIMFVMSDSGETIDKYKV